MNTHDLPLSRIACRAVLRDVINHEIKPRISECRAAGLARTAALLDRYRSLSEASSAAEMRDNICLMKAVLEVTRTALDDVTDATAKSKQTIKKLKTKATKQQRQALQRPRVIE